MMDGDDIRTLIKALDIRVSELERETLTLPSDCFIVTPTDVPGAILRGARERELMTTRDLASRSNVPQSTISKWETGEGLVGVSKFLACIYAMDHVCVLIPRRRLDQKE